MESVTAMANSSKTESKVSQEDLFRSFARLTGEEDENVSQLERPGFAVAGLFVAGLLLMAFMFGRRAGRKKTTLVEVVRL